jgi:pSer/pThr/pTyr-binding forkhead associated (FHA) protein
MEQSVPELRPVSDGAREGIEGAKRVKLTHFPFRIGRESRYATVNGERVSMERRLTESKANNELYLIDEHQVLNISREHLIIDRLPNGTFRVVDRGSTCGTVVDGKAIGTRESSNEAIIESGGRLVLGTRDSPYVYEFIVESNDGV